jgi:hypothetical protein
VSEPMPVTFEAAEKLPILSGRCGMVRPSAASQLLEVDAPVGVLGMVTTSQMDSRHGSSLEWCS